MKSDCIFCKIIKGEIGAEMIHETVEVLAFADIAPNNLGHTLIVPKTHYATLFDIPRELLSKLAPEIQAVAQKVKTGTRAEGINIVMNNYKAAGQVVHHAHIHIIPRFEGDGFEHWRSKKCSPDEIAAIAEKIRNS